MVQRGKNPVKFALLPWHFHAAYSFRFTSQGREQEVQWPLLSFGPNP